MLSIFLFIIIATVIILASIKLSNYANCLNKQTSLNSLFIGGVLLAITTSLPEFFTVLSALFIDNNNLAIGDVFGGNLFNILMLIIFDIILFKQLIFKKVNHVFYTLISLLLTINISYLLTYLFNIELTVLPILIIIIYLIYLKIISMLSLEEPSIEFNNVSYLKTKFLFLSVLLIVMSVLMTITADHIIHTYRFLAASTVGAYMLGVSTSLPEIVMSYHLLKVKNYNLAFAGIIGSNFLNLFIIASLDILFTDNVLHSPLTFKSLQLVVFGSVFYIMVLLKKDSKHYLLWSYLIIISYLILFYLQFIV